MIHKKRLNRLMGLVIVLCLLIALSACGQSADGASLRAKDYGGDGLSRYEQTHVGLFDASYTLVAYAANQAAFDRLDAALYEKLEHYHQLYDRYHHYDSLCNLCTINENAGGTPVSVESDLIDLLQFGHQMYEQTDGAVNIACGTLTDVWTTHREADSQTASLPTEKEIETAQSLVDMNALRIGTDQTVRVELAGMQLDAGAIAKGYAAKRAEAFLRDSGVTSAMLNLGGTVCAIGTKADTGEPWSVGVADPDNSEDYCLTLSINDLSAATSGDYERYYEVDGVRYCHIFDTATGYPTRTVRAVTVLSEDAALADALSTALFVLPVEEGQTLIENTENTEAVWILPDGSTVYSGGFGGYVKAE